MVWHRTVRILNAGLKCAARSSLQIRDAKKSPKIAIWAPSHNFVGRYLRNYGTYRQSEKNLLSSHISSTCPHNMVNFGPLAAEIVSLVWGTPSNLNGFLVTARHSSSRRQPNFAALNRGRHLYAAGRAAITLGIRLHSSFFFFPRLISAVADCMSTILPHMMWS